jgi:type I restriction enzyme S subunit
MQVQYQTYDSYKDSGVAWLEKVPSHWNILPALTCVQESKEKNIGLKEKTVLSLSYGRVIVKSEDKLTGLVPESFETYQIVRSGDIIIRGTDLQNDVTSLRTGLAKNDGIITSAYLNLRTKQHVKPEYLHYLLHTFDTMKVYYGMGSGLRQNLDYRDFKRLQITIPHSEEQDRIVAFLDYKTAEIEAAIEKKQRLIELLKEQKAILINQAVTKGLNPAATMKDSGIEWVGRIPEHWEVKKLKYVVQNSTTPATKLNKNLGYVGLENIESFSGKYNFSDNVEWEGASKIFVKGDILFSKLRPYLAKGFIAENQGVCTGELLTLKITADINSHYLLELLLSIDFITVVNSSTYGSKMPRANWDFIGNQYIPVPTRLEQKKIYDFSVRIKNEVHVLITQELLGIEKLKEFKQTLIAHAVTGKIKV